MEGNVAVCPTCFLANPTVTGVPLGMLTVCTVKFRPAAFTFCTLVLIAAFASALCGALTAPDSNTGKARTRAIAPVHHFLPARFVCMLLTLLPLPSKSPGSSSQVVRTCPSPYPDQDAIHIHPV